MALAGFRLLRTITERRVYQNRENIQHARDSCIITRTSLSHLPINAPRHQTDQGYDPKRSRVNDDTMMDFIRGAITGAITEVPGIGPAAAKKLAAGVGDDSITNTYQLVGKVGLALLAVVPSISTVHCISPRVIAHSSGPGSQFLMLKGPDSEDNKVESMEHCEKFWYWLQDKGISAHRSAIVKAIALKVNGLLPGVSPLLSYFR